MTQNSGGIDKILRIVVGLALIGLTVMGLLPVWATLASCRWPLA